MKIKKYLNLIDISMIYTVNNNISYNYSKFITRPKWAISLHKNTNLFVWKKSIQLSNRQNKDFPQSFPFFIKQSGISKNEFFKIKKIICPAGTPKFLLKMTGKFLDVPNFFSNWIKLKENLDKKLKVLKFFNKKKLKSNHAKAYSNHKGQTPINNFNLSTTVFHSKELLCW